MGSLNDDLCPLSGGAAEQISEVRLLRLKQIVGPTGLFPISRAAWYAGIREGRYPAPVKLNRVSFWRAQDIRQVLERVGHS
jgi:prophage regulatory protein